ncbi:DUF748 domain-containing protein [Puniceicoccaceae bacterium K14]|nr:DUF748 domain-containing protein [Puniceicoccaceae bacterium K14]
MKTKKNWVKRCAVLVGVFYALYLIVGFWVLPIIVKKNLEGAVSETLDHSLALEGVGFNPFTLTLSLEGLYLEDDLGGPLFEASLIRVNAQLSSLFTLSGRLKEFAMVDSVATVKILEDGAFNFQSYMELSSGEGNEETTTEEDTKPIGFYIGQVAIDNFSVEFSDESLATPLRDTIGPISFVTEELRSEANAESPYAFAAQIGEETQIEWDGSITIDPLYSKGEFEVSRLDLSMGLPYVQELVDIDLAGYFSIGGEYELSYAEGQMKLVTDEAHVLVDSFKLSDSHDELSQVSFATLEISGIELDSQEQVVSIEEFSIVDNAISVVRKKEGDLLLPQGEILKQANEDSTGKSDPTSTSSPDPEGKWNVRLESFDYQGGRAVLVDRSLETETKTEISSISIGAKAIDLLDENLESEFRVSLALLNGSGTLEVDAKGNIPAQKFEGKYSLSGLELSQAQSYVSAYSYALLESGSLNFDGGFEYETGKDPIASLNFGLESVQVVDSRTAEAVLQLGSLIIDDAVYNGESVAVESIVMDAPMVSALSDDAGINLASLAKGSVSENEEPTVEEGEEVAEIESQEDSEIEVVEEELMPISIGKLAITNGDFRFSDATLDPDFTIKLDQFQLKTSGISNSEDADASPYEVSARLDDTSTFEVKGVSSFIDFHKETTAEVTLHSFDLTGTVPYWRKYLGRHLDDGRLTIESNYDIKKGKLNSKNSIRIDALTLGDKVESEDALGLPVGFAISLLKDKSGVIQINPPVKGDLSDPSVGGIASIVFKVLGNLIVKAVASPFSLFSGMAGGKENLDTASIEPGSVNLSIDNKDSLTSIAKILTERPALKVGIVAGVDERNETEIAQAALAQAFLSEVIEDPSFLYSGSSNGRSDIISALENYDPDLPESQVNDVFALIEWNRISGYEEYGSSPRASEDSEDKIAQTENADSESAVKVPASKKKGVFSGIKSFFGFTPKDRAIEEVESVAEVETEEEASGETEIPEVAVERSIDEMKAVLWKLSGYKLTTESFDVLKAHRVAQAQAYLVENHAITGGRVVIEGVDAAEVEKVESAQVSQLKFILQ